MKRLALLLPLVLAACAGSDVVSHDQPVGYARNARQAVEQADWSAPRTIEMKLVNHAFVPDEITVKRGEPVRLVLVNPSSKDHTFVSKDFFKGIGVKQLIGPKGAEAGPWVEKVVVEEGTTKELWFVPLRYGSFQFECTVTGHALLGMKGVVNVQ